MALSATELTRLRRLTGGVVDSSAPDYLDDTALQAEYTSAGEDFNTTIVYVLRLRVGMLSYLYDRSLDLNSESLSQRRDGMRQLLQDWEKRTGLAGGSLEVGTIDYNIYTDIDDLDLD